MKLIQNRVARLRGFSLIEVMIAVLVLSIGLLALVALQGDLIRSGAEAKARSRIAALVASRIDEARALGYLSIPAETTQWQCEDGNEICDAESEAAVASLTVSRSATCFPEADCDESSLGSTDQRYKTVTVAASWTGSNGETRELAMSTLLSELALDATDTLLNQQLSGDSGKTPIVRTSDPATTGVVPIALGSSTDSARSAASNPTPELVGKGKNQQVVATRFDVLTYIPAGDSVQMQRRIETSVVKCSCKYGAGGTNLEAVFRTPQWPAVWTGEKYELYDGTGNAPGVAANAGPVSTATQSELCTECCRDHHDVANGTTPRFDPERSDGVEKYVRSGTTLVKQTNTSTGEYVNSCRLVRIDGMWRTAADMYSRNFGLLETKTVSGGKARSGALTDAAVTAYASFVKAYLKQYTGSTATAPTNAQDLFDATTGLNDPSLITISTPSNTDYRYLHARALYVDYLEADARARIAKSVAACPTGKDKADCVLPYLPFTSANLTEIASWKSSDEASLIVNDGSLLATNPEQPSGGRSIGKKAASATNTASMRVSNSGIAVNEAEAIAGVDELDGSTTASDSQAFTIGAGGSGTSPVTTAGDFFVTLSGGGGNPYVFYSIGNDAAECLTQSGKKRCVTATAFPATVRVRLSNYWFEGTEKGRNTTATCKYVSKTSTTQITATDKLNTPYFVNYAVSSITLGGVSGTLISLTNDGKANEEAVYEFANVPDDATIAVQFTATSTTYATIAAGACTTNQQGSQISIYTWTKPWQ